MALAYLLDPTKQYQNVAGVNNVAGWLEVFISDTPERADVYVDFAGTRATERIGIDNNGRAVMVVDGEGVYRVEMHAPNGDLLWTQYPIWPVGQGGGGAIGVDIGSSDGSIDVQRTQVGSVVNYDLSVAADGTDLLGWGEYIGYTMDGTHMVPSYSAGTIVTGPHGIRLQGGQYYHVTVTLGASSLEQNVYDAFRVSFRGVDGDGAVSTFTTKSFHYDASTGEGHSYDVSFDMMPATDVEMYAEATGLESGISVGIAEVYVHRVYSGAPAIPEGIADKEWVEDNFQEKLTAGSNITIEGNVISATADPQVQADWAQSDSTAVDYIKNKPDLSVYATGAELTAGLATKQDVISDIADIRAGAQQGATAVQPSDLASALDPYATKQELNTGLAGKQNTIDDLTQIRQGASLGSTALQPGALDPYALTADVDTALAGKQDTISDLAAIRSGASAGATAVQPGDLATVATTGAYSDLSGTPDLSIYAQTSSLATVATTGDYADLSNTPSIPVIGTVTL